MCGCWGEQSQALVHSRPRLQVQVGHLTQEPKESLHGAKHHMNTVERGLIARRQLPLMTLAIFMTNRSCPGAASYICGAGQRLYMYIGNIVQESLGQY